MLRGEKACIQRFLEAYNEEAEEENDFSPIDFIV